MGQYFHCTDGFCRSASGSTMPIQEANFSCAFCWQSSDPMEQAQDTWVVLVDGEDIRSTPDIVSYRLLPQENIQVSVVLSTLVAQFAVDGVDQTQHVPGNGKFVVRCGIPLGLTS